MPACRQRTSFRLAIAHHTTHDQIGIVEGCPEGMDQRVAEFTQLRGIYPQLVLVLVLVLGRMGSAVAGPIFVSSVSIYAVCLITHNPDWVNEVTRISCPNGNTRGR